MADTNTDTPTPPAPQVLDLSGEPDRPTVKLPAGDFALRVPEELTFDEFAKQTRIGKAIMDLATNADDPDVLVELQTMVAEGAQIMLVDLDDETARGITPGMFLKISSFFKRLGDAIVATPSESGSSFADGASGSTEADPPA